MGCARTFGESRRFTCGIVRPMKKPLVVLGVILLVLGAVGLAHPIIPYSKRQEVLKVGPLETTVEKQESVEVPRLVSGLVALGGLGIFVLGLQSKK